MEDRNIVAQLLAGSANVDRMKREIDQVVGMLLGFISCLRGDPDFFPIGTINTRGEQGLVERSIASGAFVWYVAPYGAVTCVCVHHREVDGRLVAGQVYYKRLGRPEESNFSELAHVHLVHESLPILVNGVLNASPRVRQALQPLLDAAN